MLERIITLIKRKPKLYRIENEKENMCYKITYNMKTYANDVTISKCREFELPDDIVNDMNGGYDLESIEIHDYHFNIISTNSKNRNT